MINLEREMSQLINLIDCKDHKKKMKLKMELS